MMLRARNLFLAWLTYGALQLALLGMPGAAVQPGIGNRGARPQSQSQPVPLGKPLLAPDFSDRRARTTPFAPSGHVRLDLPTQVGRNALVADDRQANAGDPIDLPPARGPPTLS